MPTFRFHKLVRDKIVRHLLAGGGKPQYHTLSRVEHRQALIEKICEEAREIVDAEDAAAEIADVQQALDDFKRLVGVSNQAVAAAQAVKNQKNGAFREGLFVETVEVKDDDPWLAYYRASPDRYPEIPAE